MTISYKWSIEAIQRRASDNIITVAHWRVRATDGEYQSTSYGSQDLIENPDNSLLVLFENVTEKDVLNWVWLSGLNKESVEKSLADQIQKDKVPTTIVGLPW